MNFYDIGYSTYEESEYKQLVHKVKYTQDEFENIITTIIADILKNDSTKDEESFQNIFYNVVEELVKNYGFKKLDFAARIDFFGWARILDETDWKGQRGNVLEKLTKDIKEKIKKI
ncbi:Uncharacterised protein [Candidatus Tiddalikarchaeum anstoanum]|nr:Uncharacterised protein [Candidatus Tiddalikarchaeum anstoanum]